MGKFRVYSVYDEKAEEFSPPFFQANDRLAMRMVTDSARGNGNMLNAYPEDFKLYRIGEFDSSKGKLFADDIPTLVASVKDLTSKGVRNVEN